MMRTAEEARAVAETIREQLGGARFAVMTGAKNFSFDGGGSLSFRIGRNPKNINAVRIMLTGLDLYNMAFLKANTKGVKCVSEADGIYAEDLEEVFTTHTGLYTRF